MTIQLAYIEQAPRSVPGWSDLMDNLCQPPAHRVARVLGVSPRTVKRYNATNRAPKAACLAIFWLTTWGRSQVNAQAMADAHLYVSYVNALRRRVAELEDQAAHLQTIGRFGSANDPVERPRLNTSQLSLPL